MTARFKEVVKFLKSAGYKVVIQRQTKFERKYDSNPSKCGVVSGKGIFGYINDREEKPNPKIDGMIYLDNAKCYNKLFHCPLRLPFPADDAQRLKLLVLMGYLGSEDGYQNSTTFEFVMDGKNPYHY